MRRRRSRDPKLERLSQVSLFSGCSAAELRRIAALTNEIDVPAGRVLIRKGDPGRECFVILEGTANVSIPGKKGHAMRPGECFGDAYRNYARLGFGGTTAELTAGLSLLERVLREDAGMVVTNG